MLVISGDDGVVPLQSSAISIANESLSTEELTPPLSGTNSTVFCSSCIPHHSHSLSPDNKTLLALTDHYVQVFSASNEGGVFNWSHSLALDEDCSPLYVQELYGRAKSFLVACKTATSFGYQPIVFDASNKPSLHPLNTPDNGISDLIFGSFIQYSNSLDTDAYVYVKDGNIFFGTIADGLPSRFIFIDTDTSCASVMDIYSIPKPVNGNFRFIMDCLHRETSEVLRYKVTLWQQDPSYIESASLLPQTLSIGVPIVSPDSNYFVIMQESNITAFITEDTEIYKTSVFPHAIQEVVFANSAVPSIAIISPGQNHKLLFLDDFIHGNGSVIELPNTPVFCHDQSCLPYGFAIGNSQIFYLFTTSADTYNLMLFDVENPENPLVKISNLALQPDIAFPIGIAVSNASSTITPSSSSEVLSLVSSSTIPIQSNLPSTDQSRYTVIVSSSVSTSPPVTLTKTPTLDSSTVTKTPTLDSRTVTKTPTLDSSNDMPKNVTFGLTTLLMVLVAIMICFMAVILLIALAIFRYKQFKVHRNEEKSIGVHNPSYPQVVVVDDKAQFSTPCPPSHAATGDSTPFSVAESSLHSDSPGSNQLVTPRNLQLKSRLSLDSQSSGVCSIAGTPPPSSNQDIASNFT